MPKKNNTNKGLKKTNSVSLSPKVIKKKKPKSKADKKYHPNQRSSKKKTSNFDPHNPFGRFNQKTTYTDENGKVHNIKTTFMINLKGLPPGSNVDVIAQSLAEKLVNSRFYSPVTKVTRLSQATSYGSPGSPVEVETSTGPKYRVIKSGALSGFSNDPSLKPLEKVEIKRELNQGVLEQLKILSAIKDIQEKYKIKEEKVKRRLFAEHDGVRSSSQASKMVKPGVNQKLGGATAYAELTKLISISMKWEWLHLIPHMLKGEASQIADNLVAGTPQANTEMMIYEGVLKDLAKTYKEGFKLLVKAALIPGTHHATEIHYLISTPDFALTPIIINAQTTNQPHIEFKDYFKFLIESLIHCKNAKADPVVIGEVKKNHPLLIFDKPNLEKQVGKNASFPTSPSKKLKF
ncbi:MAG: hypothetical protein H0W64_00550 [Gammaproteobacteria bacterium]|nr:hypothetical protein [Gammaproteobacteria bacterium]